MRPPLLWLKIQFNFSSLEYFSKWVVALFCGSLQFWSGLKNLFPFIRLTSVLDWIRGSRSLPMLTHFFCVFLGSGVKFSYVFLIYLFSFKSKWGRTCRVLFVFTLSHEASLYIFTVINLWYWFKEKTLFTAPTWRVNIFTRRFRREIFKINVLKFYFRFKYVE